MLSELAIVAFVVIPISLVGSPPLLFQWLNNLIHPSPQNQFYWSINNISLTAQSGFWIATAILAFAALIVYLFRRIKLISWNQDLTISALLLLSMYLLPYTSSAKSVIRFGIHPVLARFFDPVVGGGIRLRLSVLL